MSEGVGRITRVRIRNFKSLADVDVELEPLTMLVGRNGSGKSAFVDALMFLRDCLTAGDIPSVVTNWGGARAVKRASRTESVERIEIEVSMRFAIESELDEAVYGCALSFPAIGKPYVSSERCQVLLRRNNGEVWTYEVIDGDYKRSEPVLQGSPNRSSLHLRQLTHHEAYQGVYSLLSQLRRCEISRSVLEGVFHHESDDPHTLLEDGKNAGSVLLHLQEAPLGSDAHHRFERIGQYLSSISGGLTPRFKIYQKQGMIQFRREVDGAEFEAASVSDGTLRAFAILLSMSQETIPPLIALEEPEAQIHPAAATALMDALFDGALRTQLVVTTHSPDLLDYKDLDPSQIRVVEMEDGITHISPLGVIDKAAIQEGLSTLGEMLQLDELQSDRDRPIVVKSPKRNS